MTCLQDVFNLFLLALQDSLYKNDLALFSSLVAYPDGANTNKV